MTKYEELCGAFHQCYSEDVTYRERSVFFVARVLTGFASYIGAPAGRVSFLPPEQKDSDATYTPQGAAELEEDGWWAANVRLTLTQGEGIFPELPVVFQFRVLAGPDKFTVRLGDSDLTHTMCEGDAAALEPVYEEAHRRAKEYFATRFQRFVDEANQNTPRKIGFL